jgi:hypothetical protein
MSFGMVSNLLEDPLRRSGRLPAVAHGGDRMVEYDPRQVVGAEVGAGRYIMGAESLRDLPP